LTWKDYEQIGGVKGALDKRATLLYRSLSKDNQAFVRHLFMELVQVNEGQELTRRRATWDELEAIANSPDQLQQVVGLLADQQQRLIITDENTVEVAHEALLYEWKLLRGWIEENREHLWLRRCLEADCREWQERYQQSDDALLGGARLAAIAGWVEKSQLKLPPLEEEFLRKSLEKRDCEIQAKLEQARQLRELAESRQQEAEARAKAEAKKTRTAIMAGVLAALTLGFGLVAQRQRELATTSKLLAVVNLTSQAKQSSQTPNQIEALIESVQALQALKEIGKNNPEVLKQLQSVIYGVRERNRLEGHVAAVHGVSFQPNGDLIVSGDAKKVIKLWKLPGEFQKDILSPSGHQNTIWNVRFSPDGKMIASTSWDKTVKIWDIGGKVIHTLEGTIGHQQSVYDVSFSSDSKLLASSSRDGTIKIWDIKTGELTTTLKNKDFLYKEDYRVYSIDFNPADSSMMASSGYFDGNVNIWDLRNNQDNNIPTVLSEKHEDIVYAVRFSPNGRTLASAGQDGKIRLWHVEGKKLKFLGAINGHTKKIWGLGFSPDSNIIASASNDGTIKLWKIDDLIKKGDFKTSSFVEVEPYEILKGHFNSANRVEFLSHQEKNLHQKELTIVSAGDDKTVRIWKVYSQKSYAPKLSNEPDLNNLLQYSCNALKDYLNSHTNHNLQKLRKICSTYTLSASFISK
jgi:WD40 repeat protein